MTSFLKENKGGNGINLYKSKKKEKKLFKFKILAFSLVIAKKDLVKLKKTIMQGVQGKQDKAIECVFKRQKKFVCDHFCKLFLTINLKHFKSLYMGWGFFFAVFVKETSLCVIYK